MRESAGASREGVQSASGDAAIVRQRWAEVAAAVARSSKSTAALIDERNAMVAGIRDGVLGLQFRTAGLATTFNDRDHARRVASALHDVLGLSLRVRGLVGGDAGPKAPPARSRAERPEQASRPPSQAPSQPAPQAPPPLVPPRPASAVPQSQPRSERSEPDEPPESESPASSETRSPNSPETDRRAPKPASRAAEMKRGAEKAQPSEDEWRPSPDMEERGLVLSSDRVEIPEGPRPTRDQLASALRELESEQAARASGRPADASSPEGQEPSPGGRASASEEGTPGSPVPEAASDPRAAEEIPDPDAPDAAGVRVIRPESPEGGAGDDADVAPKAHGRSALPAQPETAPTASRGSGSTATGEPVPAAQTRAEPVPAAHAELDPAARAEPVSAAHAELDPAARAKTARGSDAFGGLPEPVELDDEPDPYFPVPEPQPFSGAAAADGRGSEDPAGVLAQLLDGDGRGVKRAAPASDTASPLGSVSPSIGAASSASGATSSAGGSSPSSPSPILSPSGPGSSPSSPGPGSSQAGAASPSESDDVPFYEQRMPMPQRPRNAEKQAGPGERARRPEQRTPVPQRPRSGGAAPRGAASISERIMAAHGQERQKPRVESAAVDDGESDVSLSDPTISQSKLVGLDVVLSTFDGTIIEEIARTDGGN